MRLLQLHSLNFLHRYQCLVINKFRFYSTESCTDFTQTKLTTEIKHKIENHWRTKLKETPFDEKKTDNKCIVVPMFPYPSGYLHLGHVRVYTISDTIARFYRLKGKNVLHPIGWDAFGLPAENAAIERKISPAEWTKHNIEHMRKQLDQLNCSFDWSRELATCDPTYYQWTQWLFLEMYDQGLAYQREAFVNWDPVDNTVLANEQVDENGCSWRSGAKVEKKLLKQWFIRSTTFAKDLYNGLDDPALQDWDDVIKMQKNWIGEPSGYQFHLDLFTINNETLKEKLKHITVWTDKPEQLMNPGFIAIKTTHSLNINKDIFHLLDVAVKNPFNEERLIPLIVCDDLDYELGSDTRIGVPAENDKDKKAADELWITYEKTPSLQKYRDGIIKKAIKKKIGGHLVSSRFQDWLISRQRYWGTPIPVIYCPECGTIPLPDSSLPIRLPEPLFDDTGKPLPLKDHIDWQETVCHQCGADAKRETDTMDTFVDSSWYFLRYLNPKNQNAIFDKRVAKKVMPVDVYVGGIEHAVLHLYMARFLMHFLKKIGYVSTSEPFKQLVVQGMVNGRSYLTKDGRYLKEEEVNILNEKQNKAEETVTGVPVTMEWEKMSKSKKNGVDPSELFAEYGVDAIRLIMLADVSPRSPRNWSKDTFTGILTWQHRLWLLLSEFNMARNDASINANENYDEFKEEELKVFEVRNSCVAKAEYNYVNANLSTSIKICQELTDELRKAPKHVVKYSAQYERAIGNLLIMFSPIAPLFASECWAKFVSVPNRTKANNINLQWHKDVLEQSWPMVDKDFSELVVIKINNTKTIIRCTENTNVPKTKELVLQMAHKLDLLKDLLKTNVIKRTTFFSDAGQAATLTILTESQKKKTRREKRKKQDSDENDDADEATG